MTVAEARQRRCSSQPADWPTSTASRGSTIESARTFFAEAEAEIKDPAVWAGELYLEYHRGTYTTQAATKLGNRRAEFGLRDSELWASLAQGGHYPATELEELWKLLLLHQFHDIIPGSGINWVYQDTARDHAHILAETSRLTQAALDSVVDAIDTSGRTHPVIAFNSLSHDRSELVLVDAPAGARGGPRPFGPGAPDPTP